MNGKRAGLESLQLSVGMIQKVEGSSVRLLLKRDPLLETWRFIVGQRLEKESFREAVIREIAWQLHLDRKRDFLVSQMALLSMEGVEQWPGKCEPVNLSMTFYPAHLYRRCAQDAISNQPDLRWFTCGEIWNKVSESGERIDPIICHFLKKWEIIQPWN